jgi:hypothetical protein
MLRPARRRWPCLIGTSALAFLLGAAPARSDTGTPTPTPTSSPTRTVIDCGPVHALVDPVISPTDELTQVVTGIIALVQGPLTRLRVCGEAGCVFASNLPAQPTYNYPYAVTVDLAAGIVNHLEVCAINCPGDDFCTRTDRKGGPLDIAQGSPAEATPTATPSATASNTPSSTPTPTASPTVIACLGDCDEDEHVTAEELITGIDIVLGRLSLAACPALDCDPGELPTVACLTHAVAAALDGCGG